jgi:hypothetical protein
MPESHPWVQIHNGYVPLKGKILNKKYRGYKRYLDFLIKEKILEGDNHYVVNKKCKGYRFTLEYLTQIKKVPKNDHTDELLYEQVDLTEEEFITHGHLIRFFNSGLEVDYDAAQSFLNWMKDESSIEYSVTGNEELLRQKRIRHQRSLVALERCQQKRFRFGVGPKSNRLYTTLTTMPREMRQFLKYKGERLVGYDLKNSQFFMLANLLRPSFWEPESHGKELINYENLNDKIKITINNKINNKSIMVDRLNDGEFKYERSCYEMWVSSGRLYRYLEKMHEFDNLIKMIEGPLFKAELIKGLFANNRFIGNCEPLKMFKKCFPQTYEVVSDFKRVAKKEFSHLLQQIESSIFLMIIAKKITDEHPNVPFFTIHDNVVTVERYASLVESIMKEEIKNQTGLEPSFGKEKWIPENAVTRYIKKHRPQID